MSEYTAEDFQRYLDAYLAVRDRTPSPVIVAALEMAANPDRRISDLLEANNRYLERARVAEAELQKIANDPYKFGQRVQAMKRIAADALAKIAARKEKNDVA